RLRQDTSAAIHWLELAAENSSFASLKLAEIYLDGKIIPKNFEAAIKWLTHAADGGFRNNPMKIVAEKCFDGRFSAAEEFAAQAWLEQMVVTSREAVVDSEDDRFAQNACHLAELYKLGLGVEKDIGKAIYWYKQSAEQGNGPAQYQLNEFGIDWETT
ncbi:MAG: tetratricopeptide repeat protein, partial [Sulfuricella sp.]